MIESVLFYKGFILGFSVAAPVGPIGLLCIRRSLFEGAMAGIATGMGAAIADTLYGVVAAFGLTFVSSTLVNQAGLFRIIGSLFLIYLGIKIFLSMPPIESTPVKNKTLKNSFFSSFLLTVTNPMTILSFSAAFAGLGLGSTSAQASALFMVSGVLIGSAMWWLFLSVTTATFRKVISYKVLIWVNRISGILLIGLTVAVFTK